ncbi:ribosomal RNA large subunit methyltransferase F-like protein, partial [Syncephalis pseudoplumigaleata]
LHPRNRYRDAPPDFVELARAYPALAPFVEQRADGTASIDFRQSEAQRALAYALLKCDFSIDLEIPLDVLCPMIPNRLNYLHWLEDLIGPGRVDGTVRGIDIGTGASCIYPLLGCRLHASWQFVATELQERLLDVARHNVDRNALASRISLVQAQADHTLPVETIMAASHQYDFCMCNPPFYASREEFEQSARNKQTEAASVSI